MGTKKWLCLVFAFLAISSSATGFSPKNVLGDPGMNQPSAIIGTLDWIETSDLPTGSPEYQNAKAVALLLLSLPGRDWCTGFMVSKDILMTNRHCVKNQSEAEGVIARFNFERNVPEGEWDEYLCDTFMRSWGRRPIAAFDDQDVTLLRCRPSTDNRLPGERWGVINLTNDPVFPDPPNIYVVHQPCIPTSDFRACSSRSNGRKLSQGSAQFLSATLFQFSHTADTMRGSSGAPVIDARSHRAFGINAGGVLQGRTNVGTWFFKLSPAFLLANPGYDRTVSVGTFVTLDGSNSISLFTPLRYSWLIYRKPAGSQVVLSDANTANPTFTPDRRGDYTLGLTVEDTQGNQHKSYMKVTVPLNLPPHRQCRT